MSAGLFSLAGKVALITGGNGGIGKAIALAYREAGAQVVATGRNTERNDNTAEELGDPRAVIALDVQDETAVQQAVEHVVQTYGRLDILVNNAGLFRGGSILDLSLEDWSTVVNVHLTGPYLCSKFAGRIMRDQGSGGKIINIGSMYSLFGNPTGPDYAAAKTGIIGLTRSMAVELALHNIQVNAILPGWFETGMTSGIRHQPRGEEIRRRTPAGHWGQLEDLVGTAIYLAAPASNFVTGTMITVDGGYSINDRIMHDEA